MDIIICKDLNAGYGGDFGYVPVLNNINFKCKLGENIIIWGPSGSGKTTLLHIFSNQLNFNNGELKILGETIDPRSKKRLSQKNLFKISCIFQQNFLIQELTCRENIEYVATKRLNESSNLSNKIEYCSKKLLVNKLLDYYPNSLSIGEIQRIGIVRGLVTPSNLILMDEPTSAIDNKNKLLLLNLLNDKIVNDMKTIIIATHDLIFQTFGGRNFNLVNGELIPK